MAGFPSIPRTARLLGFSLVELLIVIGIILGLAGLLLAGTSVVRRQAAAAATTAQVNQIHQACLVYRGEDRKHRFPPAVTEGVIFVQGTATWDGATPLVAGLLLPYGVPTDGDHATRSGSRMALADAWMQPLRYQVDATADGTVVRPSDGAGAAVLVPGDAGDWNPQGSEPYAYVWSWGPPLAAGNTVKSAIRQWIYVHEAPR